MIVKKYALAQYLDQDSQKKKGRFPADIRVQEKPKAKTKVGMARWDSGNQISNPLNAQNILPALCSLSSATVIPLTSG